jgi:DNA-binding CsgD family transcriptional regulator/tetratricopeptide (TPR) repeat protein
VNDEKELQRGRSSFAASAWGEAHKSLAAADRAAPIGPEDLELLARSAYMLGRDDDYVAALQRAHSGHLDSGDVGRAVQCAFWIGHNWLFRGETVRATGWFGRGQRLLDEREQDCVERGYMLIPVWLEQMGRGDYNAGYATAAEAAEIAGRFGDNDLLWLARDEQGRALVSLGDVEAGLRFCDEVFVVAGRGELSPIVTGIVYCNTIAFCHDAFELRHAQEWTEALTEWCNAQPDMVAHNGLCLVHRAEITQLRGRWSDAMEQVRRAADRFTQGALNHVAFGKALYRQGEIHRLRGDLAEAERAYREASRLGSDPQPGLALLRLAQGQGDTAAAAIRRGVGERTKPLERAALLPAYIEIMIAVGEFDRAAAAANDLSEIAEAQGNEALHAMAAQRHGTLKLSVGEPTAALESLRRASALWQALRAPYEVARVRVHLGLACRALGDEDTAVLELEAARDAFERLEAKPDLLQVESLLSGKTTTQGLTDRELEVLRLVAAGNSNRTIARTLVISEHTVARHVQNIFTKLGVRSRTAAGAFAYEHNLA